MKRPFTLCMLGVAFWASASNGTAQPQDDLVKQLRDLDASVIVLGKVRQPPLASMLLRDVEAKLREANRADRLAWEKVKTREDWERFRSKGMDALRTSLGNFPPAPKDLKVRVTRSLDGDGFRVDNLVYQSRPGLVVTANLYRPSKPTSSMPAILVCHSHQSSKHTSWRQDMAMTWARAGCVVLVPDHLGHGERRQHPFGDEGPHNYHFRYDVGIQLHLVGESLMGWLVYDLMRGVDVLLGQKDVDPKRVLLISEPAGGGDVAAVTAALDERITCAMVQNFGGPEPETPYPLPRDAEESFDYAGSGSWESTRNLRLSARDGFLPWQIVASIAPRRLIYYHEFYWDRERDPVWKRLQRVYGFYGASESLTGLAGHGFVVGSAPENSHWLPVNRELLYPVLERWFGIGNPKKEYSKRRPLEELLCLTPMVEKEMAPRPLYALAADLSKQRVAEARKARETLHVPERRSQLQRDWQRLLGDVAPSADPTSLASPHAPQKLGQITVERIYLATEPGIVVPVIILIPAGARGERNPVVIGLAQQGKQEFVKQRAETIARLLEAGSAVCLPDVRGTGETSPSDTRDRRSAATSVSSSEWMLGQSLLGGQLRDVRSIMKFLRKREDLDGNRIALWGESFALTNRSDTNFKVPHTEPRPPQSEPLGGLLALLGALYEDDVKAVYVQRGLSDYQSALQSQFCYVPHDAVVPGVLSVGDLCDVAASLSPRAVWLDGMVDGHNRAVSTEELETRYEYTRAAYTRTKRPERFRLGAPMRKSDLADWLTRELRGKSD